MSSAFAIEEAVRNLRTEHPGSIERVQLLGLLVIQLKFTPADAACAVRQGLPAKDAPILAAAVAAHVALLVTGDRTHFGQMFGGSLRGVSIVLPADALSRVLRNRPARD